MTTTEPTTWYVYQPRGSIERHRYGDRLWGVGGVHADTQIIGLTQNEAIAVVWLLRQHNTGGSEP